MPNRNTGNPYTRSRSTQGGNYRGPDGYGRKRRFRLNKVNIALIAIVAVVLSVIGISLAAKGNPGNNAKGTGPALQASDAPTATASDGGGQTPGGQTSPAVSETPAAEPTDTAATSTAVTGGSSSEFFTAGDVQVDDTTYKSADLYVKITNVSEGGQNYYVADCRMKDSSRLFTAMATDTYAVHKEEQSSVMAKRKGAVVAINGDYFGSADSGSSDTTHRNDKGVVIRNGQLYRKTPWYDIAAVYNDGTMKTFGKADITADQLLADGAVQAFNFGPMLLDGEGKAIPSSQLKLRPPKYNPANPRTGIGYIEPNHFVLVAVDGRGAGGGKGMTTSEFAALFESLGCKSAYNLDGGGSTTMVFMGKVINHPCDAGGERAVSDIIYFGESETDQANIDRFGGQ